MRNGDETGYEISYFDEQAQSYIEMKIEASVIVWTTARAIKAKHAVR